jgi:DNA-binding MarR family transcriptional regulator
MTKTIEQSTPDTRDQTQAVRKVLAQAPNTPPDRWTDAVAMLLVDAILHADPLPMEAFLDEVSRASQNAAVDQVRLTTLAQVAHWGIARTLPVVLGRTVDLNSTRGRILTFVNESPGCSSKDIYLTLNIAEASVSRTGSQLESDGLIYRVRAGKWRRWQLTRAGENALDAAIVLQSNEKGSGSFERGSRSSQLREHLAALDHLNSRRTPPEVIPLDQRTASVHGGYRSEFLDRVKSRRARFREPAQE